MASSIAQKVLENRLRRVAERRGLMIVKSRRRDPDAYDFGGYMICDARTRMVVWGSAPLPFSLDLDGVREILEPPKKTRKGR